MLAAAATALGQRPRRGCWCSHACIPGSHQFTPVQGSISRTGRLGAGITLGCQRRPRWGAGKRDSQRTPPNMSSLSACGAATPSQACARLLSAACTPSRHGTTHTRTHTHTQSRHWTGWRRHKICMNVGCGCRPGAALQQVARSPDHGRHHQSSAQRRPGAHSPVRSQRREHPPAWTCGSSPACLARSPVRYLALSQTPASTATRTCSPP